PASITTAGLPVPAWCSMSRRPLPTSYSVPSGGTSSCALALSFCSHSSFGSVLPVVWANSSGFEDVAISLVSLSALRFLPSLAWQRLKKLGSACRRRCFLGPCRDFGRWAYALFCWVRFFLVRVTRASIIPRWRPGGSASGGVL